MMTEIYYDMKRASLYSSLCSTKSLRQEFKIRKEIEELEQKWKEQNKENDPIKFEIDKPKKRNRKK